MECAIPPRRIGNAERALTNQAITIPHNIPQLREILRHIRQETQDLSQFVVYVIFGYDCSADVLS